MKKKLPRLNGRNGQVVLIILLVMSVILVVGLSIASRSVTDIKISQQSQESARALWVAQAGLEQAIKANQSIASAADPDNLGGVEYSVSKAGFGSGPNFIFPMNIAAGESVTLWLRAHTETGEIDSSSGVPGGSNLTFYWGKGAFNDGSTPALEATLVYQDGGNFLIQRYPYDPYDSRDPDTGFGDPNTAGCSIGEVEFSFCTNPIPLPAGTPYFVRLKLLFNAGTQPIGVTSTADLPLQGNYFDSTATVSESGVAEKLIQYQFWPTTLPIFDYLIFSGADIQ